MAEAWLDCAVLGGGNAANCNGCIATAPPCSAVQRLSSAVKCGGWALNGVEGLGYAAARLRVHCGGTAKHGIAKASRGSASAKHGIAPLGLSWAAVRAGEA